MYKSICTSISLSAMLHVALPLSTNLLLHFPFSVLHLNLLLNLVVVSSPLELWLHESLSQVFQIEGTLLHSHFKNFIIGIKVFILSIWYQIAFLQFKGIQTHIDIFVQPEVNDLRGLLACER